MLYRIALNQYGEKWVVDRIRYTRTQPDRSVAFFIHHHLGPSFTHLDKAYLHMQDINQLLHRIAFQDEIIADPREDANIKLQSKSARADLIRQLSVLTGQLP